MRVNRRTIASSAGALVLMAASATAEPDRHGKTIQQCNEELKAGKAALTAAGESASRFIHDCWWHTKAGQRTPIAGSRPTKPDDATARLGKAEAAVAKAQAEAAAAKEEAARAKEDAAEARKAVEAQVAKSAVDAPAGAASPTRKPPEPRVAVTREPREPAGARAVRVAASVVARRRRHVARRPIASWVYAPPPPAATARAAARLVEPRAARVVQVARQPRGEAPAPLVEMVPVHIVGVPRPVRWPVFPAFVPPFRYAVNHPIVPGFTWTP